MNNFPKVSASDDEDDLELLRLKALETLKRKNAAADSSRNMHLKCSSPDKLNQYGRNKRRRTFGPHLGRGGKNFQGNFNRPRNTNLISITPVSDETNVDDKSSSNKGTTLTLSKKQNSVGEGTSKFNRYDNSDESDTESEEEEEDSDSVETSPGKLERADSLEALMQELDDEIQGKPKAKGEKQANGDKDKLKTKKPKKKKRSTSESDQKNTDSKPDIEQSDKSAEVTEPGAIISSKDDESKESVTNENENIVAETVDTPSTRKESNPRKRQRSRSPFNRRNNFRARRLQTYPRQPLHPAMGQPINQFHPQMPPMYPAPHFNQIYPPPVGSVLSRPPPFYERPISPLSINTESLTTATLAPLSPRSAAFVLQNKAIIEKRKRSPRRSYSRSFSRSLSRSPRRSLTPPRRIQRRSISPRRLSRSPRRFSPRRRSLSPKRKSQSPRRRNAGNKDGSPKSNHPVRNRLGNKSGQAEDSKDKGANREKVKGKPAVTQAKEETLSDPVLEARKRKFESNQLGKKAGIIRLKPKEEKLSDATVPELPPTEKCTPVPVSTVNEEAKPAAETYKDPDEFKELEELLNEDKLLESGDDFIDHKVEDIFSDEESNSDNEGRFKVKQKAGEKVSVLSFSKLMNGVEGVKSEPLKTREDRFRGRYSSSRYNERKRRTPTERRAPSRRDEGRDRKEMGRERKETARERKEVGREKKEVERDMKGGEMEQKDVEVEKKVESQEKSPAKQRISLKKERPPPTMEKRFERKIEIKIKNPSKYEKSGKDKISKNTDRSVRADKVIEIENEDEAVVELKDEVGPENVEEVEDGDNLTVNEGDLRAQLSRKRAEKLHKVPAEEVSSRILQFALQGAVYRKTKKKSKDKNITDSESAAVRNVLHADCIPRNLFVSLDTKRKVQLYKPHYKNRKYMDLRHVYRRPDGKLPIHLRLGLANQTEILEDVKVKRKSRKRKSREVLEQVYYFCCKISILVITCKSLEASFTAVFGTVCLLPNLDVLKLVMKVVSYLCDWNARDVGVVLKTNKNNFNQTRCDE